MRTRERGAGLLIPVLLVITVAAFAVIVAASQSGSDIQGSDANADSIQALYLAETGIERALKRFATGTACGALLGETITDLSTIGLGTTAYSITIGAGLTTDFSGVTALPATQCRVPVTGTVIASNVTRTIHAIVDRNLLEGPDNPTFDNPLTAGAPSGWTLNPVTTFANDGGPDGTAPNCRRSAWLARENAAAPPANDRRASGTANVQFTVTAGSTTTITFHRRIITRGGGCPAAAAGPALPGACTVSADGTICFQMTGVGGPWTVSANADPAGAGIAACPSIFNPCQTNYQAGYPTKVSLTVAMAGATSVATFNYYMQLRRTGQKEMFLDHIEATNDTAVGAARVQVWRDCSTAADPATCL